MGQGARSRTRSRISSRVGARPPRSPALAMTNRHRLPPMGMQARGIPFGRKNRWTASIPPAPASATSASSQSCGYGCPSNGSPSSWRTRLWAPSQPTTYPAVAAGDRHGHQHRVAHRRQRHEVHTVREVLRRPARQLDRQPRLATATRAGQRKQPGAGQQTSRLGQFALPADEARRRGWQHAHMVSPRAKYSIRARGGAQLRGTQAGAWPCRVRDCEGISG